MSIRGIYGDEIIAKEYYRLQCNDCGQLLDGPVSLARDHPKKVYVITLHSKGGKVIYVESLARKRAVEAAVRIIMNDK